MVDEALIGVDHAGEVDTGFLIIDHRSLSALGDDDGEARRCDQVGVAQCFCCGGVSVCRVVCFDRPGELPDGLAADLVGLGGRVAVALPIGVDSHDWFFLSRRIRAAWARRSPMPTRWASRPTPVRMNPVVRTPAESVKTAISRVTTPKKVKIMPPSRQAR